MAELENLPVRFCSPAFSIGLSESKGSNMMLYFLAYAVGIKINNDKYDSR
jgi:hypothetical protein